MKLTIIFLFNFISCQFSIPSFNVTPLKKGKSGALNYYNLILEGDTDLDYYSLDYNEKCNISYSFYESNFSKHSIPKVLTQMRIDSNNYPTNKEFFPSLAYHLEYYFSVDNNINYPKTNITYAGNPYNYKLINYSRIQECLPGISFITENKGVVSLNTFVTLIYGFELKFDLVSINQDFYCPYKKNSNCEKSLYTFDVVIHNLNVSNILTMYELSSYSALKNSVILSFNYRSPIITYNSSNYYIIKVLYVDSSGLVSSIGNVDIYRFNPYFNTYTVKYITNQGDNDCVRFSTIVKSSFSRSTSNIIKLFINENLVLCCYLDLKSLSGSYGLLSPNPFNNNVVDGILNGKGYISLLANKINNSKQLLLLTSLYFNSENTCSGNNVTIICGGSNKSLIISNISKKDKGEIVKLFYRSKSFRNDNYRHCLPRVHEIPTGIDNPFWEKCSVKVFYGSDIEDIIVINKQGMKYSLRNFLVFNNDIQFQPLNMYNVCVNSSYLLLNIGYCDCRLCEKLLNFNKAFSFNFRLKCRGLFPKECHCFDISATNNFGDNLNFIKLNLCSECKYDSHCSFALTNATCTELPTEVRIGLPLYKEFSYINIHQTFSLDFGNVKDGKVKGEYCECEKMRNVPLISDNGKTFTYNIYNLKTIFNHDNWSLCVDCLQQKSQDESFCSLNYCNTPILVNSYSRPGGYNCLSCLYSGEVFQSLTSDLQNLVIDCVEKAKKTGENIFTFCEYLRTNTDYELTQIFIGLISHFLVECPGKSITTNGAICIPNYHFNDYSFNRIVLKKTSDNLQWDLNYQCINSYCEPSSKVDCLNSLCICYDTCPLGRINFPIKSGFRVPCSGNGVCSVTGCKCYPGYLKPNCENHCSESQGGCCLSDEDCQTNQLGYKKCLEIMNNIGICSQ